MGGLQKLLVSDQRRDIAMTLAKNAVLFLLTRAEFMSAESAARVHGIVEIERRTRARALCPALSQEEFSEILVNFMASGHPTHSSLALKAKSPPWPGRSVIAMPQAKRAVLFLSHRRRFCKLPSPCIAYIRVPAGLCVSS